MEKVVNKVLASIVCIGWFSLGWAQQSVPPLERKVTLDLNGTSVKETLQLMEEQGEYQFAYRTDLIDQNIQLTRTYTNKTTRAVLNDLFLGKVSYKERGNYIILREASATDEKSVILSGYISNKETGETIPYATIYDSTSLSAASSNEYGYYNLTIKNTENPLITVKKFGYRDTSIQWVQSGTSVFNISLEALPMMVDSTDVDTTENAKLNWFQRFLFTEERKSKFKNFGKTLQRKTQVSLVPYVGSNGELTGKTTVDYSFNTIGGFVGGVRILEIGGIFNLDWDSVSYFQMAGIFNKVGGHQRGAQFAGITNINHSDVHGAQFAGITNITSGEVIGAQSAGLINFADGFVGAQIGGIGNYSYESSRGAQIGGIFNKSYGKLEGAQVAGIINMADKVEGAQIGLLNFSEEIDGVPIGFLSYSKKGLHQVELSTNELFQANLAFKTGVNQFYNSFVWGVHFEGANPTFQLGYGIGSSVGISPKTRIFFDLQASHLQRKSAIVRPNGLLKLTTSFQWQLSPMMAIAAGPSINALVAETSYFPGNDFNTLAPYSFYDYASGNSNLQVWAGGHLALRFF
ncbi:MAG: hypothetical protein HWE22_06025 [Flavobacteriales bacterium]|nr:hypothetical protein [Flavobacteriales bacterium]